VHIIWNVAIYFIGDKVKTKQKKALKTKNTKEVAGIWSVSDVHVSFSQGINEKWGQFKLLVSLMSQTLFYSP